MKLTKSKLFMPLLISGLDLIAWVLYVVFNVLYNNSIDWIEYNKALELNPEIAISTFYNGASLIFLFIAFLFVVLAIALSIYMMAEWMKYVIYRIERKTIKDGEK